MSGGADWPNSMEPGTGDPLALLHAANASRAEGDVATAIDQYRRAGEAWLSEAYFQLGVMAFAAGRLAIAGQAFVEAAKGGERRGRTRGRDARIS